MDRRSVLHAAGWAVVLAVAGLVGTAAALPGLNTVDSGDIINGEVLRADIGGNAVNSARVANNTLTSTDIKDGTLASVDILDNTITAADIAGSAVGYSELALDSVSGGEVINGSLTGADIANDSLKAADVDFSSDACETGLVHSWARVKGAAGMPGAFTTSSTWVDYTHNCSGGEVQVRRIGAGDYDVRFVGDPAALAQITSYYTGNPADYDNIVSYGKVGDIFFVSVSDEAGSGNDGWFVITTF
jgi:hypothetical protein